MPISETLEEVKERSDKVIAMQYNAPTAAMAHYLQMEWLALEGRRMLLEMKATEAK